MPATLGTNIIDALVPGIDAIRGAIHPIAGDRQWTVTLVRRTWSGARRGEGTVTVNSQTVLSPTPALNQYVNKVLRPCGLEEEGDVVLTEVSLTYTEAELTMRGLAANQEAFYKVTDALGQAIAARYYTVDKVPVPDRGEDIGWRIHLRRIQVA